MKSSEYWKKRALSAKKKQLEASADYEAAMQSRLRDLEHDIEKEALGYLQRYANENNVGLKQAASVLGNINSTKWSMTLEEFERKAKAGGYEKELNAEYYKSRIFRLQQLHEQMVEFSKKYGMAEQLRMQNGLAKQYQNTYYLDAYNKYRATGQLDIKLNHFNEQQLKNIVYRPWKGSDFSKRIWKEYTEVLPDELTDALLRGTLFGYSPSKVVRMMRDRFQKVSERDLHRLVITEMGHAAEEATAQFYKDSNIEQYQYLATLESHTCDQCAHLDERIFYLKDKKEGINYPLIHPYCRCTTVPYDKDLPDIESRWSRDPKTGKGIYVKNMNYRQWDKLVSRNSLGYRDWQKLNSIKIFERISLISQLSTSNNNQSSSQNDSNDYRYKKAFEQLGIEKVENLKGFDDLTLETTYKTIESELKKHPEIRTILKTVKGVEVEKDTQEDTVAAIFPHLRVKSGNSKANVKYEFYLELLLYKQNLQNIEAINDTVNKEVSKGNWTQKNGLSGVIKHEMAHVLDYRATYAQAVGKDEKDNLLNYNEAGYVYHQIHGDSNFASEVLIDTFNDLGIQEPTKKTIMDYISKYGTKNPREAFAEAYSDEKDSEFHRRFTYNLNAKLKELFNHDSNT